MTGWITREPSKSYRNGFEIFHGQEKIGAVFPDSVTNTGGFYYTCYFGKGGISNRTYPTIEEAETALVLEWEDSFRRGWTKKVDSTFKAAKRALKAVVNTIILVRNNLPLKSTKSTQIYIFYMKIINPVLDFIKDSFNIPTEESKK